MCVSGGRFQGRCDLERYVRHGLPEEALVVFREIRQEGVWLSESTLCSLLKACTLLKAFQQGKKVHALVVVMGRDLAVLDTALIDFYTNFALIEESHGNILESELEKR